MPDCSPGEGGTDPVGVPRRGSHGLERGVDGVGQRLRGRDQHRPRHGVVLGLAQEVGSDVYGIGGVVGQHRDLRRAGLRVDADAPAQQPLGSDDVDVAGTGDQVDLRAQPGHAVREHRDGLRPADRVHLVDTQQRAQREDVGVRQPAEVLLRRAGDGDRRHTRGLRRDDVHDHAGGQRRETARHVQPDPTDRYEAGGDRGAGSQLGGRLRHGGLVGAHEATAPDRLLEGGAQQRVELGEAGVEDLGRYAQRLRLDPVELQAEPPAAPPRPRPPQPPRSASRQPRRARRRTRPAAPRSRSQGRSRQRHAGRFVGARPESIEPTPPDSRRYHLPSAARHRDLPNSARAVE